MKTFHVHVRVKDLQESINFYNALFNMEPAVVKPDYAKWMLSDPKVNYAISSGHARTGIEHLGFQADNSGELENIFKNMQRAKGTVREEGETTCCYAKSRKSWITDPQGIDWEAFYTHGSATIYGEGINSRLAPELMEGWSENEK